MRGLLDIYLDSPLYIRRERKRNADDPYKNQDYNKGMVLRPRSHEDFIESVLLRYLRFSRATKIRITDYNNLIERICERYGVRAYSRSARNLLYKSPNKYAVLYAADGFKQDYPALSAWEQVDEAIEEAFINKTEYSSIECSDMHSCDCCGKVRPMGVVNAHHWKFYLSRFMGWTVCKDQRCLAISRNFRRSCSQLPLTTVINKVAKYAKQRNENNEDKRRIEKYFIRNNACINNIVG